MEETKIVDNFAILLYSRTYQTLFLQILNSENQNVISKHVIKTSDFVTIELGMPLSDIQMMVFKSQQSMQILNEFKFGLEDFNTASTVEQKSNYVKLKKKFPHYSLLLQIFYQSKSSINSSNDLDEQDEKEAMRLTLEENKKQKLNEIKAMAKANMVLLGMKIIDKLFRRKKKCKTVIPSEGSLDRRMNRKNMKYKTVFVDDNNFYHFKRWNYSQTNLQKQPEVLSSKDISKDVSIQNQCDQDSDLKEKPNKNYKRQFPRKKNNKCLKVQSKTSQNSAQVKKLKIGKKTTLEDDILSIKDLSQDRNDYRRQISSIHSKKSIGEKHEPIKTVKRANIVPQKKQYYCTLDHSRVDKVNDDFGALNHPISNFFGEKSSGRDMVIRRLKNLCQQRSEEKFQIKKVHSPKLKFNLTLQKQTNQKTKDESIENQGKIQRKSKEFRMRTYVPLKTYGSHGSHEYFYQNLYNKTMNSLERQKQILNFVQSECNTGDFLPSSNMSMGLVKSHKLLQNVRMTNLSTETHETIQNTKGQCKLKKIISQKQLYRVYKIYADKSNKRKLRS